MPFGSTTLINVTGESYSSNTVSAIAYWNGSAYVQLQNNEPPRISRGCGRRRCGTGPTRPRSTSARTPPGRARSSRRARWCMLGYQQVNGPIVSGALYGTGETHLHPPNPCLPDPQPCPPEPPIPTPTPTPTTTPDADAGADEHADARADLDADTDPGADDHTDAGAHQHARADRDPDPDPDAADAEPAAPAGDGQQRLGPGLERRREDLQEGHVAEGPRARERPSARRGQGEVPHPRHELGTDPARNVRVCDLLPKQFKLIKASVKVTYRNGRPCVTVPLLKGQRQGFITIRITRTAKGVVTNVAAVRSRDSGSAATRPACACCRPERRAEESPASARRGAVALAAAATLVAPRAPHTRAAPPRPPPSAPGSRSSSPARRLAPPAAGRLAAHARAARELDRRPGRLAGPARARGTGSRSGSRIGRTGPPAGSPQTAWSCGRRAGGS